MNIPEMTHKYDISAFHVKFIQQSTPVHLDKFLNCLIRLVGSLVSAGIALEDLALEDGEQPGVGRKPM